MGSWINDCGFLNPLVLPEEKEMTTMNDLYGDGSKHEGCQECGYCKTCGDCDKFGCGKHVRVAAGAKLSRARKIKHTCRVRKASHSVK